MREQVSSIEDLRSLDAYEFEHYVAELWEKYGWETEVIQQSNDYGIDVIATKSDPVPLKALIQAKRFQDGNNVGRPDVQQYRSLLQQERDADGVVIVTTSDFTKGAREIAEDLNVKLVAGSDLLQIIEGRPLELEERDEGMNEVFEESDWVTYLLYPFAFLYVASVDIVKHFVRKPGELTDAITALLVGLLGLYVLYQFVLILLS